MHQQFISRAVPVAPINWSIKRLGLALLFLFPATALAQLDVKSSYTLGEPIIVKMVVPEKPAEAVLRKDKFKIPGATAVKVDDTTWHVWAVPGKYTIEASGEWRLYQTIISKDDKEYKVIADEDDYEFAASFEVTGGDGPVPPPPPPPPPPPGERRAVILEESEQRTTAQAILFQELALQIKPPKLQVLDDDQKSAQKYLPLLPTSMSTVRPAMLVMSGETVVRVVPLPSSVAAVKELIDK